MNCWEFFKCGREEGGSRVDDLGVCPACTFKAGQACWLLAGTFCKGEVQGTYAQKKNSCMSCEFYQRFNLAHRAKMRSQFSHIFKKQE